MFYERTDGQTGHSWVTITCRCWPFPPFKRSLESTRPNGLSYPLFFNENSLLASPWREEHAACKDDHAKKKKLKLSYAIGLIHFDILVSAYGRSTRPPHYWPFSAVRYHHSGPVFTTSLREVSSNILGKKWLLEDIIFHYNRCRCVIGRSWSLSTDYSAITGSALLNVCSGYASFGGPALHSYQ